jgi:outer membrane protein OmpA-like peptidoglycan-associated protein
MGKGLLRKSRSARALTGVMIGALFLATLGGCVPGRMKTAAPPATGDYTGRLTAELTGIENARTKRLGDAIRVTWDAAALFEFDSAMLQWESRESLGRMAGILNKYPDTDLVIAGHTYLGGPDEYMRTLSERRAESVRDCLVDMGVAPSRIQAVGYSGPPPAAAAVPGEEPLANERVEIVIRPREAPARPALSGD